MAKRPDGKSGGETPKFIRWTGRRFGCPAKHIRDTLSGISTNAVSRSVQWLSQASSDVFRQLFSSRWLGYLSLTVVFAIVATLFGLWQWDRRGQAVAAMDRVENNWDASSLSLEDFLETNPLPSVEDEWTPLVLKGRYERKDQLLVRTRPRAGLVGFEVLVPFVSGEKAVLVSRGWVPTGEASDYPDAIPEVPQGDVTLVARVKMWEPQLRGRGAPEGQVATINVVDVVAQTTTALTQEFYLIAATEEPAPASLPLRTLRPVLDEGPHLSYTFQWYLFAVMAFVGFGWMFRQEWRVSRGIEAPSAPQSSDAEEEDALLEQSAR